MVQKDCFMVCLCTIEIGEREKREMKGNTEPEIEGLKERERERGKH